MKTAATLTALALIAPFAHAIELTDLPGATASASSCYLGCGHALYDASNIIDGDYGASGNTGLNAWNSGGYGGSVQVNFGASYELDRIELYGGYPYSESFTLSASGDGVHWTTLVASGAYHEEPGLTFAGLSGKKFGAVYSVAGGTLTPNMSAQYVRYSAGGNQNWGYLFEMDVQGHVTAAPVPEPETYALMLAGLGLVGFAARRRRSA